MKRPLRILHLIWSGSVGGAERAVYLLVREQCQDPSLAPAILFARGEGYYWQHAQKLGCPIFTLDMPHGYALDYTIKAATIMRQFDLHHFQAPSFVAMLASIMCPNVKRVYTRRGGMVDDSWRKRLQYGAVNILLRYFFHGFSGNTKHGARIGAQLHKLPEGRFEVTYNGLDFDLLQPQQPANLIRSQLKLDSSHYVLGTVANLKRWKRIHLLLPAVATIADPSFRLLIVGDGEERQHLEIQAQQLGISKQVIFAGRQVHVADYLQIMDVFCLPSMAKESFGNAVVEAMSLGMPTIVFRDGGGVVEHIESGETGFIVADQAELIFVLKKLMVDRQLGRTIGQQGQQTVRQRYTLSSSANAYRQLYTHALANKLSLKRA